MPILFKNENLKEVTSDKIYIDNLKTKLDPNGLMSEQIFGPLKSYSCACGKLSSKILHNGKTCPICKVKCCSNDMRYKQYARIRIPFPMMNTLNKKVLQKVTTKTNKSILSPVQFDMTSTSKIYLYYDKSKDKLILKNGTYDNVNGIPVIISGNFSFYLAIYVVYKLYNSRAAELCLNQFFFDLLVIPPGSRQPFVKENQNKKEIINNNLDEMYIPILRHKRYKEIENFKLEEKLEEYSAMIINTFNNDNLIPIEDNEILLWDRISSTIQYHVDLIYDEVLNRLSGKDGLVRFNFLGKNIDFSGRAVVVPDPSLETYKIKIPKKAFFKLWILEYYRFLRLRHGKEWETFDIAKLLKPVSDSEFGFDVRKIEKFDEFASYIFDECDESSRLIFINRQPTLI